MASSVAGTKELIKKLKQLERAVATKILREELRTTTKQVAEMIRPLMPTDAGFLRRSLRIKPIKKKRRYTVGYRIESKPPTKRRRTKQKLHVHRLAPDHLFGQHAKKRRKRNKENLYYAFAPEYGVSNRRAGRQPAKRFMREGIKHAESLIGPTKQRIRARIQQEWARR